MQRMKLGLSWGNRMVDAAILQAQMALFGYCIKGSVWGYCVTISNLGASCPVMRENSNKFESSQQQTPVIINMKDSSSGADLTCDMNGQLNKLWVAHMFNHNHGSDRIQSCARFFDQHGRDVNLKTASSMGLATLNGSGVTTRDGRYDVSSSFYKNCGLAASFNESQKTGASSDRSKDEAATVDALMGHSSRGEGMSDINWTTTHGTKEISIESLSVLPLITWTSNRQNANFPDSMNDGGRHKQIQASSQDNVGMAIITNLRRKDRIKKQTSSASSSHSASLFQTPVSVQSIRKGSQQLTRQMALDNPWLTLMRWLSRRLPYLQKSLSLHMAQRSYTFSLSPAQVSSRIRYITQGLRRYWLENEETISRTYDGSFVTSTLYPLHFQAIVMHVLYDQMRFFNANNQAYTFEKIPAYCMHSLITTVPSITTICSALYAWLAQCILDPNSMILACHQLFLLGFHQFCTLPVIALVVRGELQDLSAEEKSDYENFATFLLDLMHVQGTNSKASNLLFVGDMLPTSREEMLSCYKDRKRKKFGYANPNAQDDQSFQQDGPDGDDKFEQEFDALMGARTVRQSTISNGFALKGRQISVFATPDVVFDFKEMPTSIMEKNASRYADVLDATDMLCSDIYAESQTDIACQARFKKCNLREYEEADLFWKMAEKGTRLPTGNNKTNDKTYSMKFGPAKSTGYWFRDAISRTQAGAGIVYDFLKLCGLDPGTTSTVNLLTAICQPFVDTIENPSDKEQYTKSLRQLRHHPAWTQPILSKTDTSNPVLNDGAYKWKFMPSQSFGVKQGVIVGLGMNIVWLVICQALYCSEWRKKKTKPSSSSQEPGTNTEQAEWYVNCHSRNQGHAARAIIEVMLHTRFDKAAIPVNGVCISAPDPFQDARASRIPVPFIKFRRKLHLTSSSYPVDDTSNLEDMPVDHNNVLLARSAHNFSLLKLKSSYGQDISLLTYTGLQSIHGEQACNRPQDIFLYPPEAIAHMPSHHTFLQRSIVAGISYLSSCKKDVQWTPNLLSSTVMAFGSRVPTDMLRIMPLVIPDYLDCPNVDRSAAEFQTSDLFSEIPFLCLRHGYIFTISLISDGAPSSEPFLQVRACEPTHQPCDAFTETNIHSDDSLIFSRPSDPYNKLPEFHDNERPPPIPIDQLGFFLSGGIAIQGQDDVDGNKTCHVKSRFLTVDSGPIDETCEMIVPAIPWPVISWLHLLLISTSPFHGFLATNPQYVDEGPRRVVPSEEFYNLLLQHKFAFRADRDNLIGTYESSPKRQCSRKHRTWFQVHADIKMHDSPFDEVWIIRVFGSDDYASSNPIVVRRRLSSGKYQHFHFNSKAEFKKTINTASPGEYMSSEDEHSIDFDFMLADDRVFSFYSPVAFHMYHLKRSNGVLKQFVHPATEYIYPLDEVEFDTSKWTYNIAPYLDVQGIYSDVDLPVPIPFYALVRRFFNKKHDSTLPYHMLSKGRYRISYTFPGPQSSDESPDYSAEMDFMSVSRCMVHEGAELYCIISESFFFNSIQKKTEGFELAFSDFADYNQGDEDDQQATSKNVVVQAFYVLGDHPSNMLYKDTLTNFIRIYIPYYDMYASTQDGGIIVDFPLHDSGSRLVFPSLQDAEELTPGPVVLDHLVWIS